MTSKCLIWYHIMDVVGVGRWRFPIQKQASICHSFLLNGYIELVTKRCRIISQSSSQLRKQSAT